MDLRNEGRHFGRSWKLPDIITKAGGWGDLYGSARSLWERPCVAIGLHSSPGNFCFFADIPGPLCGP
ncbi:hypothetical protein, partial [Pseudomonas putida]